MQPSNYFHILLLSCAAAVSVGGIPGGGLRTVCIEPQDTVNTTALPSQQSPRPWPRGVIPYKMDKHLPAEVRRKLLSTMHAIESDSCSLFIPHGEEHNFVTFENGERCCSSMGFAGVGRQDVLLGPSCTATNTEQGLNSVLQVLMGHNSYTTAVTETINANQRRQAEDVKARLNLSCQQICGGYTLLDPSTNHIEQFLGTPNHPLHYPPNLDCVWKLVAADGYALRLRFVDFDLEKSRGVHDYISVKYLDEQGELIRSVTWTGDSSIMTINQPSPLDLNTSSAVIHFHSDSSIHARGIKLGYSVTERGVVKTDPCSIDNGGCVHLCSSTVSGDRICSCRPGYKNTEQGECLDINECKIGNGGCSHKCVNLPGSFSCDCRPGLELSYDLRSCQSCNFTISQQAGSIHPTGYPNYKHNQNCLWHLKTWPGYHLKITITVLDIVPSYKCKEDFLKIEPTRFRFQSRLCGFHSRLEFYTNKDVEMRFRSKRTNMFHSGFEVRYEQVLSSELDSITLDYVMVDGRQVPYKNRVWL